MQGIRAPGLAPLLVEQEDGYVAGFPVYLAVSLRCAEPTATLTRLPHFDWFSTRGAFGVVLSLGGRVIHTVLPSFKADHGLGGGGLELSQGEVRRSLIDVSGLLPQVLAPGVYSAVLSYGGMLAAAESAPIRLTVRAASPPERDERRALQQEIERRDTWGQWTLLPPLDPTTIVLPKSARDPLRFNKLLRWITYGPDPLEEIDPAVLDVLAGVFAPEAVALRAELLLARGDRAGVKAIVSRIRSHHKGLAWWADALDTGTSNIAWLRTKPVRP